MNVCKSSFQKVLSCYIGTLCSPPGPKLSIRPSTKPAIYRAQQNMLATKNSTPILPPNSGPSARLIISYNRLRDALGFF